MPAKVSDIWLWNANIILFEHQIEATDPDDEVERYMQVDQFRQMNEHKKH